MTEATFMLFAPKARVASLRAHVAAESGEDVRWREKRQMSGSEFYVVGPSQLAREAHQRAATWLSREDRPV